MIVTTTRSPSTCTSRRIPRSSIVMTGISGSCTCASSSRSSVALVTSGRRGGCGAGAGVRPAVAERRQVAARAPPCRAPRRLGHLERRVGERRGHGRLPLRTQQVRVGGDPPPHERGHQLVALEQLGGVGPHLVEPGLHPAVRLLGAVPQPDHPVAGMVEVVRRLLDRLAGEHLVGRRGHRLPQRDLVGRDEQLAGHRPPEVAVVGLEQQRAGELGLVPQEREGILVPSLFSSSPDRVSRLRACPSRSSAMLSSATSSSICGERAAHSHSR